MFENKYIQQRLEKVEKLRDAGINPYSNESSRNTTVAKFVNVNSDVFQIQRNCIIRTERLDITKSS